MILLPRANLTPAVVNSVVREMCGIVGIWTKDFDRDGLRRDLETAVASLRHRGPDDQGIWMNESGVALGHTRLSILDLSPLGHQPMVSTDGRYVIVFNGEIYNFREIRTRLESAGHTFVGSGDNEVILRAFSERGPDAVKSFIGMFAIALWDGQEMTLDLVRDRVGVKPLYFGWDGTTLCFGSEIKALRAFRHLVPDLDRQSLGEFLRYGYVPDDRSIYKGVKKLRPGHRLRLKLGQLPVIERYWSVLDAMAEPLEGNDEEMEEALEALLVDAFQSRMVSDVPVGVYLSGGIDSSLVTALLAKHHDRRIQTFTIGFAETRYDEAKWARKIADFCGTSHTEYVLEAHEALEIARNWGSLFDEPFGDSSAIPTFLVSRLASREVKVVLSADGGDELFSGYNAYANVLTQLDRLARIPAWLQDASRSGFRLFTPRLVNSVLSGLPLRPLTRGKLGRKAHRIEQILQDTTPFGLIDVAMSHWYPCQIARLLGEYERPTRTSSPSSAVSPIAQLGLRDFHHYLPGDILAKVDRTTMAASIEGREPLLDHRLAEVAFRLPSHLKRGPLGPKHILKKILYRHIPRSLVDRPKQGFSVPKTLWLRSELHELVRDYLSPDRVRRAGLMDPTLVQKTVSDFYAGNDYLVEPLWHLLTFEMWRERWS